MQLFYGVPEDVENWMSLVTQVRWNFPGLETQEKLNEHRATVLKFMDKRQAICIKGENEIAGVMLFSRGHNMICCLAVSSSAVPPEIRVLAFPDMEVSGVLRSCETFAISSLFISSVLPKDVVALFKVSASSSNSSQPHFSNTTL